MTTARLEDMDKPKSVHHRNRILRPGNTRVPTPEEVKAYRMNTAKINADGKPDSQVKASKRIRGAENAFEQYESLSRTQNRRMHPGLLELYLIKTGQPVPPWLRGEDS